MRRIAIFSLNYYPFVGGAEVAIKEITDRIPPDDIEFHLIAYRFDSTLPKKEQVGNVLVHRIGIGRPGMTLAKSFKPIVYLGKVLYVPLAAIKAWQLHREQRFDAAWSMMVYMSFPLVLLRMIGTRIPYLLTLQEGDPFEHVFERLHIRLVKPLLSQGIRQAAAVQAISVFLLDWARRSGFTGDGEVIPNGVDLDRFARPVPEEIVVKTKEWLGKRPGDVFLVTTSRLVHKNGIDTVIASLPHLPENVHFIIYGEGPLEGALCAKAAGLKVQDRVQFRGRIDHAELPAALAACDIFIRPSRSEGMGNSFIEAMAAGLPVIATQEGGIADFLFDSKRNPDREATGWAVDADHHEQVADAVKAIIGSPETMLRTVEQAKRQIASYDWSRIARNMHGLFSNVMGGVPQASDPQTEQVLIATPLYPPELGGPATVTMTIERTLREQGSDVAVAPFSPVLRLPPVIRHLAYLWQLMRLHRGPNVLFALDTLSVGVPALIAARLRGIPLVLRLGGLGSWERATELGLKVGAPHEFIAELPSLPVRIRIAAVIEGLVLRSAQAVIVQGAYQKSVLTGWGVAPEKMHIVYNGMDPVPSVARVMPTVPKIVSAGRLVRLKRFDMLMAAVATLSKSFPNLTLEIYGEGPSREALVGLIEKHGLEGSVRLFPPLPREPLLTVIAGASAFALASKHETFSNLILEAMAVGTPVVATAVGGTPEIITSGENGILVPPGDVEALAAALRKILEDPTYGEKLAQAAVRSLGSFSKERMVRETLRVLREAVN